MARKKNKKGYHVELQADWTANETKGPKSTPNLERALPDSMNESHDRPPKRSKENLDPADLCPEAQTTTHLAQDSAEASLNQSTERLLSNKRLRDDVGEELPQLPSKRSKVNGTSGSEHHPGFAPIQSLKPLIATSVSDPALASGPIWQALPVEVQHLTQKYEFSTMSIISSSKIEKTVRNLLERVDKFNFAEPKSKPGIVILHAKASVASKMASVVEIAKDTIQKQNGNWWEYSKVHGEMLDLVPEQEKRAGHGRTLSEWNKAQVREAVARSEAINGPRDVPVKGSSEGEIPSDADEDTEESFEIMRNPKTGDRGPQSSGREHGKKVRAVALMTIFFARVAVPGLKELYGEQTNSA